MPPSPSFERPLFPAADPPPTGAYVPRRLAERLGAGTETSLAFRGTALVLDISNYTRLLEATSRLGREGVESLWQVLTRTFSSAIDVVEAHGGEVAYFAGDALICYWPEGHPEARASEQARACGRRLLAMRFPALTDRGDATPIRFHAGLASGALWAARLGGWSGRWNLLFGGAAVRAAFAALGTARAGQLSASAEERRVAVGGAFVGPRTADEFTPPTASCDNAAPGTAHLDLLPAAVERRAAQKNDEWAAEWRQIDSLFLRLPHLDESLPGGPAAFRLVLSLTQETLQATSVTGRAVIDNHGLTLVWVAGEPLTHNQGERSTTLRLAATLVRRLRLQGFRAAAGFASGPALCGTLGTSNRCEIAALGMPMVMAARLMSHAGDGLLVHGNHLPEERLGLRVQPLPRLAVKGMRGFVPVYRVDSEGRFDVPRQVVGRRAEIALFDRVLDGVDGGSGGLCLVEGAAGMGKSSLLHVLETQALARGFTVALGQSPDADRRVPYFAWRTVFQHFFRELIRESPAGLRARLMTLLREAGRNQLEAPLLNVVLPVNFGENALTSEMNGDDRARTTRDLLLTLLESRIRKRLLLVFEDVHLMDSSSVALLADAVARFPSVLFAATARPGTDDCDTTLARSVTTKVGLSPISVEVVTQMGLVLFDLRLSRVVAEQIHARAGGVPLYVRAYLHQLRRIVGPSGQAPIEALPDDLDHLSATHTDAIAGVLVKGFDGLSAGDNRTLKVASAVGERFSADFLSGILPEPAASAAVAETCLRGCQSGILEPDFTQEDAFRFTHALLRTTCYETIPDRQRRELHRRIALALEDEAGGSVQHLSDDRLVALAHHFSRAREYASTVRYAERAALRAGRQGAYREAMRLLDLCLEVCPPKPDPRGGIDPRLRWHRLKAEAAAAVGDRLTRQAEADAALALAGHRALARRPWAKVVTVSRVLRGVLCGPPRVRPTPSSGRSSLDRELSHAYQQLAIAGYFSGDALQTAYGTTAGLRHAARLGRSRELSDALASMGTCLGIIGFAAAGRRFLEAATTLASDLSSNPSVTYAHLTSALFLIGRGEWERVRFHAERCQEASLRTGDAGNWGNAVAMLFWMHHYRGEHGEAQARAGELMRAARTVRNPQHQSWAARFLALGCMRRRDWGAARDHLEEARTLFAEAAGQRRALRPVYELTPVLCDLGATLFALGRRTEGFALCEAALAELEKPRRPPGHAVMEGYSSLASVFLAIPADRRGGPSDQPAKRTLATLRKYCRVFPIGIPRLALWHGRALGARTPDAAISLWRQGVQSARVLGMAYDETLLTEELTATAGQP